MIGQDVRTAAATSMRWILNFAMPVVVFLHIMVVVRPSPSSTMSVVVKSEKAVKTVL